MNSENLIDPLTMTLNKFKDNVSHLFLDGALLASWSLTQMMTDLNPFTVILL